MCDKKIACLGWGSLIWDPRELREHLTSVWNADGPDLPIEFARQSDDGRITLVITPDSNPVPVLWARLNCASIQDARELLQRRENTGRDRIGFWPANGGAQFSFAADIGNWAQEQNLDGVVWTALGPGFRQDGCVPEDADLPTQQQIVEHLRGLAIQDQSRAREYVEKAPEQIETKNRRAIRENLRWDRRLNISR